MRSLGLVAAGYLAIAVMMVVRQRSFIYFPPRAYPVTPAHAGLAWEDVTLVAADGVRTRAWWIPATDPGAPILMYCHGNGANLSSFVDIALGCHRQGLAFFAFDYRGYGASEGSPTEAGLYRDARAGFAWLEGRGAARRVVVYGQSLGTAVAAWLAGEVGAAGLVLEASLPSTWRMARLHYPWLWVPEVAVLDRFATVSHLARVRCPVLVIHGEADDVSPLRFGREVFAAAHDPKEFLPVPGSGHNDLRWNDPVIQEHILRFIHGCVARGHR